MKKVILPEMTRKTVDLAVKRKMKAISLQAEVQACTHLLILRVIFFNLKPFSHDDKSLVVFF